MINPGTLAEVSRALDTLGFKYAFVGGSIIEFLVDNPALSPARPTDDLDIIVELMTDRPYSDIEERLRTAGFVNDHSAGAPICRWIHRGIKIDVMPTHGSQIGINTIWFSEALTTIRSVEIFGTSVPLVSPLAFIALKLAAFADRGEGIFWHHDIEDIVAVVDGRERIVAEIADGPTSLREYVVGRFRELAADEDFQDSLSGHLPMDAANQRRLPKLREKFVQISRLPT